MATVGMRASQSN